MKTINISKQAKTVNALLEKARDEDLIVKAADGTEFLLSAVDDFDQEIAQQRRNKKLMAFLDERFRQARQEKGIPLEEVKRQLGLGSHDTKVSRRKAGPHSR
ncbi:MAG TPA: hypothetical protein VH575_34950 [Gemmataceae bacterium]|jgi:hypothetical protein